MKKQGVFVVTGASRGLGREVAVEALRRGFPAALIARSKRDLEKVKKDLEKQFGPGLKVSCHALDLRSEEEVTTAFHEIIKIHGSIRALVNNAGTWTGGKSIEELSTNEIRESLDLNFFSAVHATKACLKLRSKSKELAMVNIGATASLRGWKNVSAFCLAKGALRSFSESLARELGPQGVHVSHLVIDGLIDNERTRKLNPKTPENKFLSMRSLSNEILNVALQEKSCWTFEWDVRPYNESW